MSQSIERGLLTSFDPSTYTASVQLVDALSTWLTNVPIATHVDGTSAQIGALCIVIFLDEQNSDDACIIAIFPNAGVGFPSPPPGRVTFLPTHGHVNAVAITSGTTNTYTLAGAGGIPSATSAPSPLGVLLKVFASSPTVGAWTGICDHGGDINNTFVIGNQQVANQNINGNAIIPLSSDGKIDVKANGGTCTVTIYSYGYVF
jgi:hypothetical protein